MIFFNPAVFMGSRIFLFGLLTKVVEKDKNILLNCIDKTIKKMYIENIRGVAPVFILIGG